MTITVTNIEQGPFVATGNAQTVSYTFMTLTDTEIDVFYQVGDGERILLDPALHTVQPNKSVEGDAVEGGAVEIAALAVPAGASIWLAAAPLSTRQLQWRDAGSRLRNLNEEQDRDALRDLVLSKRVVKTDGRLTAEVDRLDDRIDAVEVVAQEADEKSSDALTAVGNLSGAAAVMTLLDATGVKFSPYTDYVSVSGYSRSGDGGGAKYRKVDVEPTHAGKFQSADGAWWELDEVAASPTMFGGKRFLGPINNAASGFRGTSRNQFEDARQAFLDAVSYVAARMAKRRIAYVYIDGYYFLSDWLPINDQSVSLLGRGRRQCGVRIGGYSALRPGIHVQALDFCSTGFEICADDRGGSDPGDTGHTGTCITTGDFLRLGVHNPATAYIDDMLFTRAVGARKSHAIAFMGNTRSVSFGTGKGVEIDGSRGSEHQMGILMHWGGVADGVGQPITETYHPRGVVVKNVRMRSCDRAGFISSAVDAEVSFVETVAVGSGWGVSAGDEADAYACADDAGRVMSRVSITDQTLKGLTGSALSLVGRSTSKVDKDSSGADLYRMMQLGSLCFDRWDVSSVDGSASYHAYIDFSRCASFTMDGWRTKGKTSSGYSVGTQRCRGFYSVRDGDFDGGFNATDSCDFDLSGSKFTQEVVAGKQAMNLTGRTFTRTLAAAATKGDTSIVLSSAYSVHIGPGDPINLGSCVVYATDIVRSGITTVPVTPLAAAVSSGANAVLDNRTANITGVVGLVGGEDGLLTDGCYNISFGGYVEGFGRFGHSLKNGAGLMRGITFRNGGLMRADNGSLNTVNVVHDEGSFFTYEGCDYGVSSPFIAQGVRSLSNALGGRHTAGRWHDHTGAAVSSAAPSYGRIEFFGCVKASDGTRIGANAAQTWSPVLKIGTTTPTQAVSGATYSLLDTDTVRIEAIINVTTASGTGSVTVEGLPYSSSGTAVAICRPSGAVGLTGVCMVRNSGSNLLLEQTSATGSSALTEANVANGTQFRFSLEYRR